MQNSKQSFEGLNICNNAVGDAGVIRMKCLYFTRNTNRGLRVPGVDGTTVIAKLGAGHCYLWVTVWQNAGFKSYTLL